MRKTHQFRKNWPQVTYLVCSLFRKKSFKIVLHRTERNLSPVPVPTSPRTRLKTRAVSAFW